MRISIANISESISESDFKTAVHAVERQVKEDFASLWGMDASIRMVDVDRGTKPNPELLLSDAILYVGETNDDSQAVDDAVGYHASNMKGIPYGFVFADVAKQIGESWSTTLSHEVLELIADPEVNLLVLAPHPKLAKQVVLRPYEVCDPVQGDMYIIDGVKVSNFVTPLYFADLPHPTNTQTNHMKLPLQRFGVRPNGYYSYLDISTGQYQNVFGERVDDQRLDELKELLGSARRQRRRMNTIANDRLGLRQDSEARDNRSRE
jgi:hypothetical protein